MTEEDLRPHFARFGRLERVRILSQKKCAFVDFETQRDGEALVGASQRDKA